MKKEELRHFSIRARTILLITSTLSVMLIILILFSQTIVRQGFETVENRDAALNIGRVRDAFDLQVETLRVKIIDWSMWDDAYKYMQEGSPEFEKSSLAEGALLGMKLDLFIWRLPNGEIRWGREFNFEKFEASPLRPEVREFFDRHQSLFDFKSEEDIKDGIVDIPGYGPMFVAIQPVVTSEGKGPIAGALIAARAIAEPMTERLSKLTHLKLSVLAPKNIHADPSFKEATPHLVDAKAQFIKPVSESEISGFTQFWDLFGQPVVIVKMTTPRDIHAQGKRTIWSFVFALVLAGLGFGMIVYLSLDKFVIARITSLSGAIDRIRLSGDIKSRVPVSGRDEITSLSESTNHMLDSIESAQHILAERHRDMNLILDNAAQGFINVDLDGHIVGERSSVVDRWLGSPSGSGRDTKKIWDYLFGPEKKHAQIFKLQWSQLAEDVMPFEVTADQMPRVLERGAVSYGIEIRAVRQEDKLFRVLIVVSDITAILSQKASENEQRELMSVFQHMLVDKGTLIGYFDDTKSRVQAIIGKKECDRDLQLRDIHTIKGNSAQYGLERFANYCHELESRIFEGDHLGEEDLLQLEKSWDEVEKRFEPLLSRESFSQVDVTHQDIETVIGLVKNSSEHARIEQILTSWTLEPIAKRLQRYERVVVGLAERLGKGSVSFEFYDHNLRADATDLSDFWASMVHVIRNAVDHGIEDEEIREKSGQTVSPKITLSTRLEGDHLVIEVKDNGKGIHWNALRDKAREKGLPHETAEDLIAALFADGLSTKGGVTEVSGRGVGMSAVKQAVINLGGKIKVISEEGQGTTFRFEIPTARVRVMDPT